MKKWSKASAEKGGEEQQINVIWFCIDGTSSKLFPETITSLSRATKMWESVPVIVVITKSYSKKEREANVQMVYNAFAQQKRYSKNLKAVIPVVAETYHIDDEVFVAPEGIIELIDKTNDILPEGIRATEKDIATYKLRRKRAMAKSVIAASTAAGAAAGSIPVPLADAAGLGAVEAAEVTMLRRIFEIDDNDESKKIMDVILNVGTASVTAEAALSALKAIPGVNLAAEALNAITSGAIVATIGGGASIIFERVYRGELSSKNAEEIREFMEERLDNKFVDQVGNALNDFINSDHSKQALRCIVENLAESLNQPEKETAPSKA